MVKLSYPYSTVPEGLLWEDKMPSISNAQL